MAEGVLLHVTPDQDGRPKKSAVTHHSTTCTKEPHETQTRTFKTSNVAVYDVEGIETTIERSILTFCQEEAEMITEVWNLPSVNHLGLRTNGHYPPNSTVLKTL
ncbi:hypothetical protein PR048_010671 [Dryococelus australis]|uniref:Uncharacterized protein n=1 Tax=Dryococelus australis TaxID=614101 RepID=A0ABQ9I460_9NEOP|nr:hypothetical protein PR048_010671 [Dryococelus australis]